MTEHKVVSLLDNSEGGVKPDLILVQECGEFTDERFEALDEHVRDGYCFHPPVYKNGVGCIARMRVKYTVLCTQRLFQVIVVSVSDSCNVVLVHAHIPDPGLEAAKGTIAEVLADIDQIISKLWVESPWHHLVFGGDFNTELPLSDMFGPAVSGAVWDSRVDSLVAFTAKWQLQWTSTFAAPGTFTHSHYT